jgi:hypothetical protein
VDGTQRAAETVLALPVAPGHAPGRMVVHGVLMVLPLICLLLLTAAIPFAGRAANPPDRALRAGASAPPVQPVANPQFPHP